MGISSYWAAAIIAVAGAISLVWLRQARKRGPDATAVSMALLSQLTSLPGTKVTDYCVSGDLTSCLGIDQNSRSLLFGFAVKPDSAPTASDKSAAGDKSKAAVGDTIIKRFPAHDIDEVEIVEDGETIARTARNRRPDGTAARAAAATATAAAATANATTWRSDKPRTFSTIRTLVLRIVVNDDERRVHIFNLLGTDTTIDRADPTCIYATQVGERWFDLISGLIDAESGTNDDSLPGATFKSRAVLHRQLADYLSRENGDDDASDET